MNRIYVQVSTDNLKSLDRGRCYLAYLLIRCKAKSQAGGFNLEFFLNAVDLKERAGKAVLSALVDRGMVRKELAGNYRVVAHKSFFEKVNSKQTYVRISDEELQKFSLKRIASFRAYIVEIECERYKRHQRSKVEGFSIIDPRSKHRERIRNPRYKEWSDLMALQCSSDLTGIPMSTIWGYRKKQDVSKYKSKPFMIKREEFSFSTEGKMIDVSEYKGKVFHYKGGLIVSPVSTRLTELILCRG